MAAPSKQSSRWGTFLQQAVAGVESSLDNILAGGEEPPKPKTSSGGASLPTNAGSALKSDAGNSRSSSTNSSTNDRLQERLARAVAAKSYTSQKIENSRSSSPGLLRLSSTTALEESPRHSVDTISGASDEAATDRGRAPPGAEPQDDSDEIQISDVATGVDTADHLAADVSLGASDSTTVVKTDTIDSFPAQDIPEPISDSQAFGDTVSEPTEPVQQQSDSLESTDHERQAELNDYVERIDTLQAKLQYLARESAISARRVADVASPNSAEKRLAEKEEQIALLMEEGQKLSKTELRHMNTIKKLRAKVSDSEKEASEMARRLEKAEKEKLVLSERLKKVEAVERQSLEKQKLIAQLQKEMELVKSDRDAKSTALSGLKSQMSESASQITAHEVKTLHGQLENEREHVTELENDISSLKIEKELEAGRAKAHLEELRAKSERDAERARALEIELRGELQMLESRLEIMRARAEEVSSGSTGDAQAKLLRQVETLQTQHAIASENWQGIEASLRSRVSNLEKERDETLHRESDIRRKAREVALKGKKHESDLDDAHVTIETLRQEIIEHRQQIDRLQRRVEEGESAFLATQKNFDQERGAWKNELQQRIDEEREKWREESQSQSVFGQIRAESPMATSQKGFATEFLGFQNLQARRASSRSNMNDSSDIDRRASRPSSAQRIQSSGHGTPQRQDSSHSFSNGDVTETPSIHEIENDDYFESVLSPSSPPHTTHDMISVSTVGAGPSVQLVERMSAAVRRLESEKVSTKEEMVRLTSQRDEARAEIVTLIGELEVKNTVQSRIQELEEENKKINARYQTTLEMLGEKSEVVEELKADVEDVKAMYRELVERTVK